MRGVRPTERTRELADAAQAEAEAYRGDEPRPLGGYVLVMALFFALVAAGAGLAAASGRGLPERIGPYDLLLLTLGTHKLSRTIAKDSVTSPLRAPFTRYKGSSGPAEVAEEVRAAQGWRKSIGELIACPFCLGMWISTGFAIGFVFAPRITRLVAATFAALTGADFLQLAYARAQQAAG